MKGRLGVLRFRFTCDECGRTFTGLTREGARLEYDAHHNECLELQAQRAAGLEQLELFAPGRAHG